MDGFPKLGHILWNRYEIAIHAVSQTYHLYMSIYRSLVMLWFCKADLFLCLASKKVYSTKAYGMNIFHLIQNLFDYVNCLLVYLLFHGSFSN